MWPAFPTSDYYGGSVPSHDQQPTAGLPATGLDSRRGGRSQDGSHVHHQPVDGVGAQLFPGSLATGTPQTFPVASWPATSTGVRVALPSRWLGVRCGPAPIRQISSRFLSCGGSTTGSCNTYTFPSRLPGPGRLAVPTRPVVVGAAPTLPCASRVRLPPASPGRCDSPEVGLPSHPVKWRLVAHEVVEKLLTSTLLSYWGWPGSPRSWCSATSMMARMVRRQGNWSRLPWRGRCSGSTSGPNRTRTPQVAKPLDALPERGMLALGGIQVGKHYHGQALPGGLT
jgi:hypothetical protein